MVECNAVTKRYGPVVALRELSFSSGTGGIIGLLGQNGAGKTTTLNLLTGYFPPTSGTIRIDGKDMLTESRACKRMLGYLPEKPPLYDEMTVREYLTFVCRLREVEKKSIPAHTADIMRLCGLTDVAERLLGHLSKGYRQRAGIAQALCGDPPLLIFDEPTVGLDPRQVVEIRGLIREIGQTHTIIFSSHILSEVQQLCSRVLILHKGKLLRDIRLDESETHGTVQLRASVRGDEKRLLNALQNMEGVRSVQLNKSADGICDVEMLCDDGAGENAAQERLFRLLCALNMPLYALSRGRETLEETFLRLTGEEAENE